MDASTLRAFFLRAISSGQTTLTPAANRGGSAGGARGGNGSAYSSSSSAPSAPPPLKRQVSMIDPIQLRSAVRDNLPGDAFPKGVIELVTDYLLRRIVFSVGAHATIKVFDIWNSEMVTQLAANANDSTRAAGTYDLCLLPDLHMVGTVNRSQHIVLWDYRTFECAGAYSLLSATGRDPKSAESDDYNPYYRRSVCCGICYLPVQQSLAVGCDQSILIWHVPTKTVTHTLNGRHGAGIVLDIVLMPDRDRLVSMAREEMRVWSLSSLEPFTPPGTAAAATTAAPATVAAAGATTAPSSSGTAAAATAAVSPSNRGIAGSYSLLAPSSGGTGPAVAIAVAPIASAASSSSSAAAASSGGLSIDTKMDLRRQIAADGSAAAAAAAAVSSSGVRPVSKRTKNGSILVSNCLRSMRLRGSSFSYALVVISDTVVLSVSYSGRVHAWCVDTGALLAAFDGTVNCDAVARVGDGLVVMQQRPAHDGYMDDRNDDEYDEHGNRIGDRLVLWEPVPKYTAAAVAAATPKGGKSKKSKSGAGAASSLAAAKALATAVGYAAATTAAAGTAAAAATDDDSGVQRPAVVTVGADIAVPALPKFAATAIAPKATAAAARAMTATAKGSASDGDNDPKSGGGDAKSKGKAKGKSAKAAKKPKKTAFEMTDEDEDSGEGEDEDDDDDDDTVIDAKSAAAAAASGAGGDEDSMADGAASDDESGGDGGEGEGDDESEESDAEDDDEHDAFAHYRRGAIPPRRKKKRSAPKPNVTVLLDSNADPSAPVFVSLTLVDAEHLAGSTESGEWCVFDLNRLAVVGTFAGKEHQEQTIVSILD